LGNIVTDDPEGQKIFESVLKRKEERIRILTVERENTSQRYLKFSDEEDIGKTCLAQRRKGRQGLEK